MQILQKGPGPYITPCSMLILYTILRNQNFCYFHLKIIFFTGEDQMFITINFNFISFISFRGGPEFSTIRRANSFVQVFN